MGESCPGKVLRVQGPGRVGCWPVPCDCVPATQLEPRTQLDMVVLACHPSTGEAEAEGS
jgi:hypothetical protein